jgi:hypothetical protein
MVVHAITKLDISCQVTRIFLKKEDVGRACNMFAVEQACTQGLAGKPDRMRPLAIPVQGSKDNIKTYPKETVMAVHGQHSSGSAQGQTGGLL